MHKEYSVKNSSEILDNILLFLKDNNIDIVSEKVSINYNSSQLNAIVFKDYKKETNIIICGGSIYGREDSIYITACDSYNSSNPWDSQVGGLKFKEKNYCFYTPTNNNSLLVCNYNNGNILISVVEPDIHMTTYNTCIGYVKTIDSTNPLFISGILMSVDIDTDGIINRINNLSTVIKSGIDNAKYGKYSNNGWCYCEEYNKIDKKIVYWTPYTDYNVDDIVLFKGSLYKCSKYHTSSETIDKDITSETFIIYNNINNVDGDCATSFTTKQNFPTYYTLISMNPQDRGRTVNCLNNVSMILPTQFFVLRDPESLGTYSYIGYTDIFNYVNMYNLSSNSTYKDDTKIYNCLSVYRRRYNNICGRWYIGIAFKEEGE